MAYLFIYLFMIAKIKIQPRPFALSLPCHSYLSSLSLSNEAEIPEK